MITATWRQAIVQQATYWVGHSITETAPGLAKGRVGRCWGLGGDSLLNDPEHRADTAGLVVRSTKTAAQSQQLTSVVGDVWRIWGAFLSLLEL